MKELRDKFYAEMGLYATDPKAAVFYYTWLEFQLLNKSKEQKIGDYETPEIELPITEEHEYKKVKPAKLKEQSEERECEYEELFESYPFEIAHNPNCAKCVNGVCVKSTKQSEPKEAEKLNAEDILRQRHTFTDRHDLSIKQFDYYDMVDFAESYASQAVAKREEEIEKKIDLIKGDLLDNPRSDFAIGWNDGMNNVLTHLKNKT